MDRKKLLIADDNQQYCKILTDCFARCGVFDILPPAFDGAQALERLRSDSPHIMILDMVMPVMDGIGVLQAMKESGLSKQTSVFANSSFIDDDIIRYSQELGVVYFFAKPLNEDQMLDRVLRFVSMGSSAGTLRSSEFYVRPPRVNTGREQIIANYLRAVGVPPHISGYVFLKSAIDYCVEHYGTIIGLTTIVYPYVAHKHSSERRRVERNVRHAIEYAWDYGDIETQHKLFGYTVNDLKGRPTNKEFIALITDRVVAHLAYNK